MQKEAPGMNIQDILKNDQLTQEDKNKLTHRPDMPDKEP